MYLHKTVWLSLTCVCILMSGNNLWASCGSALCPIDTVTQEKKEIGALHLDYSYQYIDQNEIRVGVEKGTVGQIQGHHDEIFTLNQIQTIRLGTAITSRLSVDLSLPFIHREHQHFHNHHGEKLLEQWNINGIGDLTLQTRFAFLKPQAENLPTLSLIFGGKFPTGKSDARGVVQKDKEENNLLDSKLAELGIQPGTGAYDLIVGASSLQFFSVPMMVDGYAKMPLTFEVLGRFTGKGRHDYRLGNSLIGSTGIVYPLTPKLGVSNQINLRYAQKDEKGATHEEIDKTGGVWIYVSPGVQLNLTKNVGSYVHVQVPVYQNVNVIQPVSSYNLLMGVTYRFNLI